MSLLMTLATLAAGRQPVGRVVTAPVAGWFDDGRAGFDALRVFLSGLLLLVAVGF